MATRYSLSAFRQNARNPEDYCLPDNLEEMIERIIPNFEQINPSEAFMFVFDFSKMKYLFVSQSIERIMGYTPIQWKDGGIDWVVTILYQEDAGRLNKLHRALFDFYYSLPIFERKRCRYAYELRMIRKDGKVLWMLQQGSFIEIGPDGKPTVTFDILTDVTPFKKDTTMTLNIITENNKSCVLHFPIEEFNFSKRELEILRLVSEGMSSKLIGEQLFISTHTVDTHRRNMLKRTGKRNSTELIFYAREKGLFNVNL